MAKSPGDKTYRIIPSNCPPISLFEEDLPDEEERQLSYILEGLSSQRTGEQVNLPSSLNLDDTEDAEGYNTINAAICYIGNPSRFTNGDYGVYYAAFDKQTAIDETVYWREKILSDPPVPPCKVIMRVYTSNVLDEVGELVDVSDDELAHELTDYNYSQNLAAGLRDQGEFGLLYNSVRSSGGQCIAVFKASIMSPAKQSGHLAYYWDGEKIYKVAEVDSNGNE